MKWDTAADQHLLLAILSAHKVTVDHIRVAQIVGCTPRACEERIKKLRKLAKECGYEAQSSTSPFIKKGGKKARKGGKDGGKGKCMDDADMVLYRKGIVSDDIEVKVEDGIMIKKEIVKREFGIAGHDGYDYGYGYGYGYGKDVKSFIKQQEVGGSPFRFAASPSNKNFKSPSTPYASTAAGFEIPLGVPLAIASEPLTRDFNGGKSYDFNNCAAPPLKKESQKLKNWYTPSKTPSPRTGYPALVNGAVEFIEISPASKKNPMVINDDDGDGCGDGSDVVCQGSSCVL